MSQQIFTPQARERAVLTTIHNLLMADIPLQQDLAEAMKRLSQQDDCTLALILMHSRKLLYEVLECRMYLVRN